MTKPVSAQRGVVLVVSLLMLLVITLLVVSSVNTGVVDLRIVDNMHAREDAQAAAQQAIERVLTNLDNFDKAVPPDAGSLAINGLPVNVAPPVCLRTMPAAGYSARWNLAPQDTLWEVEASTDDPATGATVDVHQGTTVRLVANSCP